MEAPQPKKKKYLKNTGITFVMVASVMCLNPYWWLFAVPLLFIGLFMISVANEGSKKPQKDNVKNNNSNN